jgi:hypothetical protein
MSELKITSPTLGMTGQIDAIIKIKDDDRLKPFELKTGKTKSECHNAQCIFYVILLSNLTGISKISNL